MFLVEVVAAAETAEVAAAETVEVAAGETAAVVVGETVAWAAVAIVQTVGVDQHLTAEVAMATA